MKKKNLKHLANFQSVKKIKSVCKLENKRLGHGEVFTFVRVRGLEKQWVMKAMTQKKGFLFRTESETAPKQQMICKENPLYIFHKQT